MLTMMHNNPATLSGDTFKVDRKFHLGMQVYAQKLSVPLLTIHPQAPVGRKVMDSVEIPVSELSYQVMTVEMDRFWRPQEKEVGRLRDQISKSQLIYDGGGTLGTPKIARAVGVPYILILEYDLSTQMRFAVSEVDGLVRRSKRAIQCVWDFVTAQLPDIRAAHEIHCNGYPIYDSTRHLNSKSLLYLDSRMTADQIISRQAVQSRLDTIGQRPFRILYSGRYEAAKGACDAVRVGVECLRRGLDIEMHCYGQGTLSDKMRSLAAANDNHRIFIHDAVSFPELVSISRSFDLFVCCHIQSDPSCTYLESFGSGLPIVGYANRMWARLSEASGAGFASAMNDVSAVADNIARLMLDHVELATMSHRAIDFISEHTFDGEFAKRIDALNRALIRPCVLQRQGVRPSSMK